MALTHDLNKMQWATDLSDLANQARFGLKYFLSGKNKDEMSQFLSEGIRLCHVLSEGAKAGQSRAVVAKQIRYLNAINPLRESKVDLKEIEQKLNKACELFNLVMAAGVPSENDVKEVDSFLAEISKIYQKSAFSTLDTLMESRVLY